jgi:hypothetical protein
MSAPTLLTFAVSGADVAVIAGGVASIAFLAWFFFGKRQAHRAQVRNGMQEVEITVKGGYSPDVIELREGIRARLIFNRPAGAEDQYHLLRLALLGLPRSRLRRRRRGRSHRQRPLLARRSHPLTAERGTRHRRVRTRLHARPEPDRRCSSGDAPVASPARR